MPRIRQSSEQDEQLSVDLDTGFMGVNDRLDASMLRSGHAYYDVNKEIMPPGLLARAVNNRCSNGQAETRPGVCQPAWFNLEPHTALAGAGIWSDPNGSEWMLTCDIDVVRLMAEGRTPRSIALPPGVALDTPTEPVQAFQTVTLFRGTSREPLIWSGIYGQSFRPVSDPGLDESGETPRYLSATPAADWGVVSADRMWVPYGRDGLAFSDLLDYAAFDLSLNVIRINQGDDDAIVAAAAFEKSLLVWKSQSIYRLDGIFGGLQQLELVKLNRELGCIARKTVAQVGGDFLWLASGGVYRLSEAYETRQRAVPTPVSQSIDRTFGRINWQHAHKSSAVVVDRYYLLNVPLDGATEPNAILVLDLVTGEWQGVDIIARPPAASVHPARDAEPTYMFSWSESGGLGHLAVAPAVPFPVIAGQALVRTDLNGRKTAFLVDSSRVLALGHGRLYDHIDNVLWPIHWEVQTRGYILGGLGFKKFRAINAAYGQQSGTLEVTALTDGVQEEQPLMARRARNRFRFRLAGRADWRPAVDRFDAAHREDYTLVPADGVMPLSVPLNLEQEWTQAWPVRLQGRWIAVRFAARGAHFTLKTLSADGLGERQQLHTKTA